MRKYLTQGTCLALTPAPCKISNGNTEGLSKKIFVLPALIVILLYFSLGCSKPSSPAQPPAPPPVLAAISTNEVGAISQTTGSSGGWIVDDGGARVTVHGICWSTTINPTISDSKTSSSSDTAIFTNFATGLQPNTTYYIRAYATNSVGTAYGNQVKFTTLQVSDTTVADIDGNVYHILKIGTQQWTLENLKTMHYQNGDDIPIALNDGAWQYRNSNTQGACSWYLSSTYNYNTVFGNIYNWYAAVDSRKIAPAGWHVPTEAEWTTLIDFLGGANTAGLTMKEAGLSHWVSPNTGATNSSGFTALPAGYRNTGGTFDFIGNAGWWWSTADAGSDEANALGLFTNLDEANIVTGKKGFGVSIRCIKN